MCIRLLEPDTYEKLFSTDPQGFGLLLILNDIGDPKKTLKSGVLWLKDKTMIRPGLKGTPYGVWQFHCTHGGFDTLHRGGTFVTNMWAQAQAGRDPVMYMVDKRERLNDDHRWKLGLGLVWQAHVVGKGEQLVRPDLWQHSKTGEVNTTGFKQQKKGAVARLLEQCHI